MKSLGIFLAIIGIVVCQKETGNSHSDIMAANQEMFRRAASGITGFSSGPLIKEEDMLEGDIVMTRSLKRYLNNQRSGKKVTAFDAMVTRAWPNGRVPFTYGNLSPKFRRNVDKAVEEYNRKTCIRFVRRTNERSFIEFVSSSGCFSMLGMIGGRQQISLGRRCDSVGVTIHEMMHALGFFHEQSRLDRDNYIRINWNNIPTKLWRNFEKYEQGQADTLGAPYDKQSIMHYSNKAFSTNGEYTIESVADPKEQFGQRKGLSEIDALQLNRMYKCKNVKPLVKPKGPCKDKYELCPILAKERLCDVSVSFWVKENCQKSCKSCPVPKPEKPELPKCQSYSNREKNCATWSRTFCKVKLYQKFMGKTCFQCGKCIN